MRSFALTAALLFGCAAPTFACLNDNSTELDEGEFRRSYAEDEEREEEQTPLGMILAAIGGTLSLGGVTAYVLKGGALAAAA